MLVLTLAVDLIRGLIQEQRFTRPRSWYPVPSFVFPGCAAESAKWICRVRDPQDQLQSQIASIRQSDTAQRSPNPGSASHRRRPDIEVPCLFILVPSPYFKFQEQHRQLLSTIYICLLTANLSSRVESGVTFSPRRLRTVIVVL